MTAATFKLHTPTRLSQICLSLPQSDVDTGEDLLVHGTRVNQFVLVHGVLQ